ncbi:MAG TPA: twin-arginine translocase TatA/TatE family subunit [Bryobacteraceae bacterium]|jgi:sec-independent protein translocase protein TatA|nr:twin-arginine translocase TatA/TatE family subunit [Bryobacteraceae bacterium]
MIEGLLRPQHLLIIFLVLLVLFGGKKLPELGKGLGEGIKGFKDSMRSVTNSDEEEAAKAAKEKEKEKEPTLKG